MQDQILLEQKCGNAIFGQDLRVASGTFPEFVLILIRFRLHEQWGLFALAVGGPPPGGKQGNLHALRRRPEALSSAFQRQHPHRLLFELYTTNHKHITRSSDPRSDYGSQGNSIWMQ